jgi:hypothetical protein
MSLLLRLFAEGVYLLAMIVGLVVLYVIGMGVHHVLVTLPRRRRERKGKPPRRPRARTIGGGKPY